MTPQQITQAAFPGLAGQPPQPPTTAWTINDPAAPWYGAWDVFDSADMPHELQCALCDELGLDDDTCGEVTVLVLADVSVTTWREYGGGSSVQLGGLFVITGAVQMPTDGCEYPGLYSLAKISAGLMARLQAFVRAEVQK